MGRSTRGEDVEREAEVPEVHARSRRPSWCSRRCAGRGRSRSSAASTTSLRRCCAAGASSSSRRALSASRQGRAHRGRRAAPSGRASSSGRWGARRWRSRSRGNSCGAGSEHARRPVPRARRARPPRRVVARVAGISRQAIYRRPARPPKGHRRPLSRADEAILGVARENPTDGTRMVAALASRDLGRPVNRKRVQRLMREHRLLQRHRPRDGAGGPGSSASSGPISSGTWT